MMGLKDDLLGAARRGAGRASEKVLAGLNRADELGGELRDYLLSRTDSPVLRKLGVRMARLGGVAVDGEVSPYAQAVARQTVAAPPPTAAEETAVAAKRGLGDPDVAAQVYGRDSCPWTGRTITLLNKGKIDFDFVNLDDPEHRILEGTLVAETKQPTVPYVYLRGEFVGGYNELDEVVRLGQLEYKTLPPDDRAAADAVRSKVEIAPRAQTGGTAPGLAHDPADPQD